MGGHAAAGQAGGDQRALVQRAAPPANLGGRGARRGGRRPLAAHADKAYRSFNEWFWYEDGGYLFDVVDGKGEGEGEGADAACRPNQLLAFSLAHPALEPRRWELVLP